MNQHTHDKTEGLIDAYLHGELDEAQRIAFEHRLQDDRVLRAEVEAQRRIDAAMHQRFEAPSADTILARAGVTSRSAQRAPAPRRVGVRRGWAVAAALLVTTAGVSLGRDWIDGQLAQYQLDKANFLEWTVATVYQHQLMRGMKPDRTWSTPSELATALWQRLGQGLIMAEPPADVTISGLAYSNVISPRTTVVLAKVGGSPVMVFIDHVGYTNPQAVAVRAGLNRHERVIGGLMLYEISQFKQPHLLDLFEAEPAE